MESRREVRSCSAWVARMSEYLPLQRYEPLKVPTQFKMLYGISAHEPCSLLFYLSQSLLHHKALFTLQAKPNRTEPIRLETQTYVV